MWQCGAAQCRLAPHCHITKKWIPILKKVVFDINYLLGLNIDSKMSIFVRAFLCKGQVSDFVQFPKYFAPITWTLLMGLTFGTIHILRQHIFGLFRPPSPAMWAYFRTEIQLRGNQKDFNFQLHHRLSKFEVPVVVNLQHIFELFGLYNTCFLIQKLLEVIRSSSDGQFWRKSQNKKAGNLN